MRCGGGIGEREGENGDCAIMSNSEGCLSGPEFKWLETEISSSASAVGDQERPASPGNVGGSDGYDTPGFRKEYVFRECNRIEDKRNHDKRMSGTTGKNVQARNLPGQLERKTERPRKNKQISNA